MKLTPARWLRGTVIVAAGLAVAAAALGFVPSREIYVDQATCVHHGAVMPCPTDWVLAETRPPVDHPLAMAAFFLAVLAPGLLLVWRRPTLGHALAWSQLALATTFFMLLATVQLFEPLATRTVLVAPAGAYASSAIALLALVIAIAPTGAALLALAARRRPPSPTLPVARIARR